MVIHMARRFICGVGINDTGLPTGENVNGKFIPCPFYLRWYSMLERCYSKRYQAKFPTYIGCSVVEDWLRLSSFKLWMQTQDWRNKQLDKDLIFYGNKLYSPETCVFVDSITNSFLLDRANDRGDWPLGVYFNKKRRKFKSQCSNPFTGKRESAGYFNCPDKAHQAWKKRKHELACQLAELQTDERVANTLRARYL